MPKVTHTDDPLETLQLEDEATGAIARLAPARGGMVTRFSVGDVPVFFLDEATLRDPSKSIRGGIPVLFPIAGRLHAHRYSRGDIYFSMKQHAFARNRPVDGGRRLDPRWCERHAGLNQTAVLSHTVALATDRAS